MIKIVDLTKTFNNHTVLNNINLTIKKGELFVLIGPSGSGKTTLLKMINKMETPDAGKIFINNENISKIKGTQLRRKIGYVIQSIGLLPHMSVKDNILIVPKLIKMDKSMAERRVYELLELVELEPEQYINKYPHQLSGGEAQRVGIARALAADPPIVLMDEPFGALDPITKSRLQNQICQIHKTLKKTIVFVTHDIDEAIKIGQRIAIIKDGQIIQTDSPQDMLSKPKNSFIATFLGSDRALKKLSKLLVKEFKKKADYVLQDEKEEVIQTNKKYVWVVDKKSILKGWIYLSENAKQFTEIDHKTFALNDNETLKDAVSKMVAQSVKTLPVCDKNGKLTGEISLTDIVTKT
ncbi:ABC transporter ATP-binding protein [Hippea maritima]|uniref:Glycine betaine/L-proline ABC transporter, ATPase subunit n=1 Tax=Hippea maritima (strain ATCC 700847 / DSM 10411 / MH2) TaxID=760142 RepID=F2LVC7_HIPMA|nr:ABC transporter ATP-binding protein [Hippea maritima]AEA33711.1 glycine betaine/L-proline ABC transporter, ATPase subunit [Hippea maritima DSM 10411]